MDFKEIKLIIFDCDGVLTDGVIAYSNNRIETKNFSAKDGLGIKLLACAGITPAIITGRESEIVAQRCADLGIKHLYQDISNKLKCAQNLLEKLDLKWCNVAYVGDDWNDYPVLKNVGFSASPADAFKDFKQKVDYVAARRGGDGAVREVIEYILKQRGDYNSVVEKFICSLGCS